MHNFQKIMVLICFFIISGCKDNNVKTPIFISVLPENAPPARHIGTLSTSTQIQPLVIESIPELTYLHASPKDIAPLLNYINNYQHDPVMLPYVEKVKQEYNKKCQVVYEYYAPFSYDVKKINHLSEQYSRFCPHVVAAFIDRKERSLNH